MGKINNKYAVAFEKNESVHEQKTCTICGVVKSIDEFYPRKDAPDKHTYHCKICQNTMTREWRKKHKKYIVQYAIQYAKDHPEQTKLINKKYKSKSEVKERIKIKAREYSARYRSNHYEEYLKKHRLEQREYKKRLLLKAIKKG